MIFQLTQDYLKTTRQTLNLKVTVLRGEAKEVVDVKVNYNQDDGKYKLGITQATRHMNIAESFQYTFVSLGTMSMAIFSALGQLVTKFSQTVTQLSGQLEYIKLQLR